MAQSLVVKTAAQIQSELAQLSLDLGNTLQSGANVAGPVLGALLTRQASLVADLCTLQVSQAAALRYGSGAPLNTLGVDNDLYRNTLTGDEYQKVNGAYVLRLNIKGQPGYTPVKGKDYFDGEDGRDGTVTFLETYPPDNEQGENGDLWIYINVTDKTASHYKKVKGKWRLIGVPIGGSSAVTPTTYTSTYTTTAQDWVAKCGAGTSGAPVTATKTANTQEAADAAAKAEAIAGITCAVFTSTQQSYTVTQADIDTKCGDGTTAFQAITRNNNTATGNTQANANAAGLAAAKAAALAAIVCTVPPPSFNTTYNPGDNISTVTWNALAGVLLMLNLPLSTNTDTNPATMYVFAPDGVTALGQADYNGADTGAVCGIFYNNTLYVKTLTNGNLILS
ncbi:hypothetical protein [Hymenobacter metallicola]|uniref:Uncharacterized protein n=1 Tax=Hymenobacter metallicola TaxID=2563114 RepID=A0A4Z0PYG9_9BACT|nr:hypothetical protein [Hymenobacter metallicola]TGE22820.1 hypothetical protein E5K02_20865 [Hymenobacter metallicola]